MATKQETPKKELTVYEKLSLVQAELNAPKDLFNKFGNYSYRSAESILSALKPLLSKYEAFVTLTDELTQVGDRFYVKATARFGDAAAAVSVSGFAREEETKKGMDGSQITGASSSYARKYALNGLFAIDDTKDSDATNTHGKDDTQSKQQAVPKWNNKPKTQEIENPEVLQMVELAKQFKEKDKLVAWAGALPENVKNNQSFRREIKSVLDSL